MEIIKSKHRICEEADYISISLAADEAICSQIRSPRDRSNVKQFKTVAREFAIFLALPLRGLIWIYQKTYSPDHGPRQVLYPYGYCKFFPSCSAFADLTLKQEGLLGFPKIIKRLLSCW